MAEFSARLGGRMGCTLRAVSVAARSWWFAWVALLIGTSGGASVERRRVDGEESTANRALYFRGMPFANGGGDGGNWVSTEFANGAGGGGGQVFANAPSCCNG